MWKLHSSVMEEENGGEGSGGTPGGEGERQSSAEVQLLTKTVGQLAIALDSLKQNQDVIVEGMKALKPKETDPAPPKSLEERIGEVENFDEMTNTDLVKFITGTIEDKVGNILKGLEEKLTGQIGTVANEFHSKTASEEVSKLKAENGDLMEWAPEIKQLMTQNPTLTVARALVLARAENPQKTAEMTKKYAKAPADAKQRSYGLLPTSSMAPGTGKMSMSEASAKAFDEVFGGLDHLLDRGANVR